MALDSALFTGWTIGVFLYGVQLTITAFALYLMARNGQRWSPLSIVVITLSVLATMQIVIWGVDIGTGFVAKRLKPGGNIMDDGTMQWFVYDSMTLPTVAALPYYLGVMAGDSVILWRLYVVWQGNLRALAMPAAFYTGNAGAGVIYLIHKFLVYKQIPSYQSRRNSFWGTVWFVFVIGMNLSATGFIIGRTLWSTNQTKATRSRIAIRTFAPTLVESGIFYTLCLIVYLFFLVFQLTDAAQVMMYIMPMVICIAPALIVLRLQLNMALDVRWVPEATAQRVASPTVILVGPDPMENGKVEQIKPKPKPKLRPNNNRKWTDASEEIASPSSWSSPGFLSAFHPGISEEVKIDDEEGSPEGLGPPSQPWALSPTDVDSPTSRGSMGMAFTTASIGIYPAQPTVGISSANASPRKMVFQNSQRDTITTETTAVGSPGSTWNKVKSRSTDDIIESRISMDAEAKAYDASMDIKGMAAGADIILDIQAPSASTSALASVSTPPLFIKKRTSSLAPESRPSNLQRPNSMLLAMRKSSPKHSAPIMRRQVTPPESIPPPVPTFPIAYTNNTDFTERPNAERHRSRVSMDPKPPLVHRSTLGMVREGGLTPDPGGSRRHHAYNRSIDTTNTIESSRAGSTMSFAQYKIGQSPPSSSGTGRVAVDGHASVSRFSEVFGNPNQNPDRRSLDSVNMVDNGNVMSSHGGYLAPGESSGVSPMTMRTSLAYGSLEPVMELEQIYELPYEGSIGGSVSRQDSHAFQSLDENHYGATRPESNLGAYWGTAI
ncbi:hypothetical protein FRB98_002867 [Tulasnella sp. 332]|nr:hypothetical protein FRB98_002867 [Tulasnella sp. 332]